MQTTTDVSSSATSASRDVQNTEGPVADAERHALKRTYLTLLPHTQLVELCLAFEAYSPAHIKRSLWPANLAAAVAELQSPAQETQQPPTSLDANPQSSQTAVLGTDGADLLLSSASSHETPAVGDSPRLQQTGTTDDSSQLTSQPFPSTSSTQSAAIAPSQGLYPHLSYGYPQTQPLPAYPHTPYYTPFSHPHSFPPHPSASYAHTHTPSQSGQFTGVSLARHPHPIGVPSAEHGGIPAEDLPSYEDMLVEALIDLNELDGSAPKSLFTWMASRYPLHSNFRPSASQALQKAFKRGRLEKGNNGKYRLNASWDGGSTSKRTTRRPQTIGQSALPASHAAPTSSPFTHTPLAHAARNGLRCNSPSPILTTQSKPPHYPGYPYQYASGGSYPGYVLSEPPSISKDETTGEQEPTVVTTHASTQDPAGGTNEDVEEGSDAWEAAQTILKAINFGSLLQASNSPVPAISPLSPPVQSGTSAAVPDTRPAPPSIDGDAAARPVQALSNRDRASLQAQLALLAAQLAEIAEDTLASDLNTKRCTEERKNLAGAGVEEKGQGAMALVGQAGQI